MDLNFVRRFLGSSRIGFYCVYILRWFSCNEIRFALVYERNKINLKSRNILTEKAGSIKRKIEHFGDTIAFLRISSFLQILLHISN
mgnify:CR=1 FL=1